jgi:hypothetical protein
MRTIAFILLVVLPHLSFGDCISLPPKKCVKLKALDLTEAWPGAFCVNKVELIADSSQLDVFFKSCPKKGDIFTGNLIQRADITITGMAVCRYEFQADLNCH